MRDMCAKGRNKKGEQHGQSRLSDAAVREIRSSTAPQRELAKQFGVNQSTISRAKRGLTWEQESV
jgi:DNA invertase Pin-like site-specific DNA recombinase